ncbi:MFS general substrate transporter [Hortaea werneckii]|nr:MFS general substrate transporter [Hortaea werneckii]
MQSYLQYKRFRDAAAKQLERDRVKLRNLQQEGGEDREPEWITTGSSDESKTDLEKNGSGEENARADDNLPRGVHPGDADPSIDPSLPQEEEEIMQKDQRPDNVREEAEEAGQGRHEREGDGDDDEDDDDDYELAQQRTTLSRMTTQHSTGTALGNVLTGINVRKRSTKEGGDGNVFVVGYEGPDDPNDPHNWPLSRRIPCTFLVAGIGCVVGIASAIESSALKPAAEEFGVAEVVESMATGLFLIGFGAGSLFAGPISETVGRNPVYICTLAIYMCFLVGCALAPNIGGQLAMRFIAGCFASTPLTCAGGTISDLWNPLERVFSFPIFANAAFTGPLLGPVMGGYIVMFLDWRWVEWITLIASGLVLTIVVLFQPETYPPILLKWKAQHLRELTGDERYRSEMEIRQQTFLHRLQRALWRPFLLTSREPIIILIALYLTVIYIVLFGFLDGYPYIFTDVYGINEGVTGLCFLGIIVGLFGATALVPIIYKWAKRDLQKIQEQGGDRLPPEFRLWYSMLGGSVAIPISLFWMGWTDYPHISIWSPLAASVLFGYGILCVFITCYQYIIDAYEAFAASALASITLIRYAASGGMVIVSVPFYENMGVHYTLTILACLSALLVPVPYVFYKYGPWIRSHSNHHGATAVLSFNFSNFTACMIHPDQTNHLLIHSLCSPRHTTLILFKMVYTLVVHLYAKADDESINKLVAKLQEASQVYSNDKETLGWFVMQSESDKRAFTIVERYAHESSQKYHLENPYWQTFDKYVVPLLDKPMDLRRLNELDTSKEVRVEHDQKLWENVKKHQSQS